MKPKHILSDKEKTAIVTLYEMGHSDETIASLLKLPRATFRDILKYNDLTVTVKKVKGTADVRVEESLYREALCMNNTTAKIFWLCNRQRERWANVNRIEHSGGDKAIDVNITGKVDLSNIDDETLKRLANGENGENHK
jgi:hypothetical protein